MSMVLTISSFLPGGGLPPIGLSGDELDRDAEGRGLAVDGAVAERELVHAGLLLLGDQLEGRLVRGLLGRIVEVDAADGLADGDLEGRPLAAVGGLGARAADVCGICHIFLLYQFGLSDFVRLHGKQAGWTLSWVYLPPGTMRSAVTVSNVSSIPQWTQAQVL